MNRTADSGASIEAAFAGRLGGFTLDHRHADHQIAQQRNVENAVGNFGGEGQHVGGVVLVPPGVVQFAAFGFVDQSDGQFRIGRALAQRQLLLLLAEIATEDL